MAVSRDYNKINIILDAYATQFAIDFDVNTDDYGDAINIKVYLGLDELTKDVDYTITNKTVNYPDAVNHVGEKLTIYRETPIEQPVDFVDNGNFTLEDIEAMGDRAIMILQEQGVQMADTINAQESAERAEQYKDIAIEKASDAEDWAVGTRSDGESPQHSSESSKHYAEAADTSANLATSMRNYALGFARESEGYAKGTQAGTPVDSSSPYYEANSKYYSEQAGTSATSASASATKASEWADKHEDSEVETGRYSAKHWAAKASTSAGGAAVSAYNAGLSETKAGKWAEEAEDVEVETGKYSAKHYSLKASASASAASTSETNADTSAKDSEAWAVGTRNGADVDPSDPAYHNNSKYYAAQIGQQTVTPDNAVTLTNKTIPVADNVLSGLIDIIYPVGSIYMSVNNVSPSSFLGGTWEQIQDTFLLAAGTTYTAGSTGGEATHKLITSEMPKHRHSFSWSTTIQPQFQGWWMCASGSAKACMANAYNSVDSVMNGPLKSFSISISTNTGYEGSDGAHNNMPPYLTVYMWKRTA